MKKEVLEIKKISKISNNQLALNKLSFSLYEGEILGITGKNNSGIPELMDILMGNDSLDEGNIFLLGSSLSLNSNFDIQKRGLTVISPDTTLLTNFSVEENIGLSWVTMKKKFLIKKRLIHIMTSELFKRYNIFIDSTTKVKDLNTYEQSVLKIVIACLHGARVIILYDMIRSLTKQQWSNMLELVKRLRTEGFSFIIVSYDFKLLKITDRIIVLRSGTIGGIFYSGEYNFDNIYKVLTQKPFTAPKLQNSYVRKNTILEASDIRFPDTPGSIDFSINSGEIIGFTTRENEPFYKIIQLFNGETEYRGKILLSGEPIVIKSRTYAFKKGICCIKKYGSPEFAFPNLSVPENILMLKYRDFSFCNVLNTNMCRFAVKEYEKAFDKNGCIWNSSLTDIEPQLQFELFLNKWLTVKPKIILLDNIFSGADADMQNSIFEFLEKVKSSGIGMIFYSTVYSDIKEICDTIYTV